MFFERSQTYTKMIDFVQNNDQNQYFLLYGKKRSGKTFLLKQLLFKYSQETIYFQAQKEDKTRDVLRKLNVLFKKFMVEAEMKDDSLLAWNSLSDCFKCMNHFAERIFSTFGKKMILILDEAQYMNGSQGDISDILQKTTLNPNLFKIILSSSDMQWGESKLQTHNEIEHKNLISFAHLSFLSLNEVLVGAFHEWNVKEKMISFVLTGGRPYLLSLINSQLNFTSAMNELIKTELYQKEIDTFLSVSFNDAKKQQIDQSLESLKNKTTFCRKDIETNTLKSKSVVHNLFVDMHNLGLINNNRTVYEQFFDFFISDHMFSFYYHWIKQNSTTSLFDQSEFLNFLDKQIIIACGRNFLEKKFEIIDYSIKFHDNCVLFSFQKPNEKIVWLKIFTNLPKRSLLDEIKKMKKNSNKDDDLFFMATDSVPFSIQDACEKSGIKFISINDLLKLA